LVEAFNFIRGGVFYKAQCGLPTRLPKSLTRVESRGYIPL
jgi:hypothetical protein